MLLTQALCVLLTLLLPGGFKEFGQTGGLGCSGLLFLDFRALVKTRLIFCLLNLTFSCFYSVQLKEFLVSFCVKFGIHKALEESTWEHIKNPDILTV